MRKIVIFRDDKITETINGRQSYKTVRTTLRTIRPDATWEGISKKGDIIDHKMRELASVLEPTSTGCYSA